MRCYFTSIRLTKIKKVIANKQNCYEPTFSSTCCTCFHSFNSHRTLRSPSSSPFYRRSGDTKKLNLIQDKQLGTDRAEMWIWTSTTATAQSVGSSGREGKSYRPRWELFSGTTVENNVHYRVKLNVCVLFNSALLLLGMDPKETFTHRFLGAYKSCAYHHGLLQKKIKTGKNVNQQENR